jgi:hypothetical protein
MLAALDLGAEIAATMRFRVADMLAEVLDDIDASHADGARRRFEAPIAVSRRNGRPRPGYDAR